MPSVLITGCSTGIGHAACEFFADRGWDVYAGSRHPKTINFQHSIIKRVALDINDIASINSCFASLPPLDVLVNNAGYGILLPFEDTPPAEIEKMFRTNVFGLMEVTRKAAKMMREQKQGTIINISSVLGTIGNAWYAAYCATKWAVEGFSESLAHELKPFNVHVKMVEPSGTKTEFHHTAYDTVQPPITEDYRERFEKKRESRMRQAGYDSPESIAELIYKAAMDDSWRLRYGAPQARRALFWQRVLGRDGLWRRIASQ